MQRIIKCFIYVFTAMKPNIIEDVDKSKEYLEFVYKVGKVFNHPVSVQKVSFKKTCEIRKYRVY
jgi:hypothetical protein